MGGAQRQAAARARYRALGPWPARRSPVASVSAGAAGVTPPCSRSGAGAPAVAVAVGGERVRTVRRLAPGEVAVVDGVSAQPNMSLERTQPLARRRLQPRRPTLTLDGEGTEGVTAGLSFYPARGMTSRHPAVRTGWTRDVYITLLEVNDAATAATLRVAVNPLIAWIWAGGADDPRRRPRRLAGAPPSRRGRPGDGPGTSTEPAEPAWSATWRGGPMREPSGRTRGRRTWGAVIALAVVGGLVARAVADQVCTCAASDRARAFRARRPARTGAGRHAPSTEPLLPTSRRQPGRSSWLNVWVSRRRAGCRQVELPLLAADARAARLSARDAGRHDGRPGTGLCTPPQALLDELGVSLDLPAVTDPGRPAGGLVGSARGSRRPSWSGRDGTDPRPPGPGRSHPNGSSSTRGHWRRKLVITTRRSPAAVAAIAVLLLLLVVAGVWQAARDRARHPRAAHGRRRGGAGVPARRSPSPRSGQPRLRGGGPSDGCKEALV